VALAVDVGFWVLAVHGVTLVRHAPPERLVFGATLSNTGLALMLTAFAMAHERAQKEAIDTLASAQQSGCGTPAGRRSARGAPSRCSSPTSATSCARR
jgi:hypothetical protein